MALSFPRELRLLTPKDFRFTFQKPCYATSPTLVILARKNSFTHPRIGMVVAKKVAKRAHDRNRVKRIVRESFRMRQSQLPMMDFIVIAKKGILDLSNHQLVALLDKLWQQHIRLSLAA